jgi:hypothetical protein
LTSERPLVSEIATNYLNFKKITKTEVAVSPQFAGLCRGFTPSEIAAMRERADASVGVFIYMNDEAADTFGRNAKLYPVGSVVVKQKRIQEKEYGMRELFHTGENGVGGMVKRSPGYDSAHGDWEYFYFDDPAKIQSGRIASCVQCHETAKGKDYVFGTWNRLESEEGKWSPNPFEFNQTIK